MESEIIAYFISALPSLTAIITVVVSALVERFFNKKFFGKGMENAANVLLENKQLMAKIKALINENAELKETLNGYKEDMEIIKAMLGDIVNEKQEERLQQEHTEENNNTSSN